MRLRFDLCNILNLKHVNWTLLVAHLRYLSLKIFNRFALEYFLPSITHLISYLYLVRRRLVIWVSQSLIFQFCSVMNFDRSMEIIEILFGRLEFIALILFPIAYLLQRKEFVDFRWA